MMVEGQPYPVWSGSFKIFGIDLKCHTLSTGERIIEEESVAALFAAMEGPWRDERDDTLAFNRWLEGGTPK